MDSVECSGPADYVVVGPFLAFQEQVGLADSVGFRVDLLTVQVGGDVQLPGLCDVIQGLLCDREHPSGPDRSVVEDVGVGLDVVLDGEKHQLGHQLHGIAGSPVFAGLLVVLLVEPADQVLEYGSHGVVVEPWDPHRVVLVENRVGAEIHCRGQEPLNQCVEHTAAGEPGGLVPELELLEDILDVG